jgi:uncharacterized protein
VPDLIKRLALTAGKICLFLIVWGALYAPFVVGGGSRVTIEIAGAVTVLLAAWIFTRWIDKRPFVSIGFEIRNAGRDLVAGLVLGLAMMSLVVLALWSFGFAEREPLVGFSWTALAIAAVVMMTNTVTQEVLVRGYVQQTIQSYFGAASGVIFSALLFTLLHAPAIKGAPLPAANLFAAGLLLSVAYVTTRNLWLPIGIHFGWNFLQGPVLGLTVSGQSVDCGWRLFRLHGAPLFTGGMFGPEGGLIAGAVTLLGVAAVAIPARVRRQRASRRELLQ